MPTCVYSSDTIIGHQYVNTSGYTVAMRLSSGNLPVNRATYVISSAVLKVSDVRQAYDRDVAVYIGGVNYGQWMVSGTPAVIGLKTDANADYAGLTSVVLYGIGSTGMQIASGAVVTLTIAYELNTASITPGQTEVVAGETLRLTVSKLPTGYRRVMAFRIIADASTDWSAVKPIETVELTETETLIIYQTDVSWVQDFPTSRTAILRVNVASYYGTSYKGNDAVTLTIKCPDIDKTRPTFTAGYSLNLDIGEKTYPAFGNLYVQGACGVVATITDVQTKYGATVVGTYITVRAKGGETLGTGFTAAGTTGTSLTLTSKLLEVSGELEVLYQLTDSRGMMTQKVLPLTVTPYAPPSVSKLNAYRVDASSESETGYKKNDMGAYGWCDAAWSCVSLGGLNTCKAWLMYGSTKYPNDDAGLTAAAYEGIIFPGGEPIPLSKTKSHEVKLIVKDLLEETVRTIEIPSANFFIHFNATGNGVGIGQAAEETQCVSINPAWGLMYKGAVLRSNEETDAAISTSLNAYHTAEETAALIGQMIASALTPAPMSNVVTFTGGSGTISCYSVGKRVSMVLSLTPSATTGEVAQIAGIVPLIAFRESLHGNTSGTCRLTVQADSSRAYTRVIVAGAASGTTYYGGIDILVE